MDEDTIPLEAGIEQQAISFTKGCYVGQEVIIRVLHRGHGGSHSRLVGLLLETEGRSPRGHGAQADGKEIGSGDEQRDVADARSADCARLRQARFRRAGYVCDDAARSAATVVALPFVARRDHDRRDRRRRRARRRIPRDPPARRARTSRARGNFPAASASRASRSTPASGARSARNSARDGRSAPRSSASRTSTPIAGSSCTSSPARCSTIRYRSSVRRCSGSRGSSCVSSSFRRPTTS